MIFVLHLSNLCVAILFTSGLAFLEKEPKKFECEQYSTAKMVD